jgi:hypothetical protein
VKGIVQIDGKTVEVPSFLTAGEARYPASRKNAQAAVDEALALSRRLPGQQQLIVVRRVLGLLVKARRFAGRVRAGKEYGPWDRQAALEVTGMAEDTPDGIVADAVTDA